MAPTQFCHYLFKQKDWQGRKSPTEGEYNKQEVSMGSSEVHSFDCEFSEVGLGTESEADLKMLCMA